MNWVLLNKLLSFVININCCLSLLAKYGGSTRTTINYVSCFDFSFRFDDGIWNSDFGVAATIFIGFYSQNVQWINEWQRKIRFRLWSYFHFFFLKEITQSTLYILCTTNIIPFSRFLFKLCSLILFLFKFLFEIANNDINYCVESFQKYIFEKIPPTVYEIKSIPHWLLGCINCSN